MVASEKPTQDRTSAPTVEPSEAPSDAVASSNDTNNGDLARTSAGVVWMIMAGVGAILIGVVAVMLRPRNATQ